MASPPASQDRFAPIVLSLGVGLLLYSSASLATSWIQSLGKRRSTDQQEQQEATPSKAWHESVVQVTYSTDPSMCQYPSTLQPRPLLLAGALLRLIDVVAGVAARRHAGAGCVTVSLDSVIFLSPIYLGDLIHLSAAVNRSFGSSMEVGVRVLAESPDEPGRLSYVSHAYLTFVMRKQAADDASATRPRLPRLVPETKLQWRRHFLAGHRRARRLAAAAKGVDEDGIPRDVLEEVRKNVMSMAGPGARKQDINVGSQTIDRGEREIMARAMYGRRDSTLVIKDEEEGWVSGHLRGEEEDNGGQIIRQPLSEVKAMARDMGLLDAEDGKELYSHPRSPSASPPPQARARRRSRMGSFISPHLRSPHPYPHLQTPHGPTTIAIEDTLASHLQIVFPSHTNSVGILFGGETMAWLEQAALISARNVARGSPNVHWKTVAMDGLEFKRPVVVGEVMTFTAVVLRTFSRSCEVYVVASAESHDHTSGGSGSGGGREHRRFTNDALFTLALAAPSPTTTQGGEEGAAQEERALRQVVIPEGSALQALAAAADRRKMRRLQLREMLVRIYGPSEEG